ncbi:MAG: diacylglycerol kinase [Gammaproteobacteria bacterium]
MRNERLGIGEPGYHPLRKLRTVWSGLSIAIGTDFSVAYKVLLSIVLLAAAFVLREWVDALLILAATAFVIVAELFNTAIETICDFIEPRHDRRIGAIKDIAAAAVGIAILVWALVIGLECYRLYRHFGI